VTEKQKEEEDLDVEFMEILHRFGLPKEELIFLFEVSMASETTIVDLVLNAIIFANQSLRQEPDRDEEDQTSFEFVLDDKPKTIH